MGDDFEVEAAWLVELGNSLNVAGDCAIGAAGRLRRAATSAERNELRSRIRGYLRHVVWAAGAALAIAEDEKGSVDDAI
jgi:hypothetical protein